MNIKHVELPEGFMESIGDKLEFLMKTQADHEVDYSEIERRLGYHYVPDFPLDINNRYDQGYFKSGVYYCIEELSEATNCLKNRVHVQTEFVTDEEHFIEEMADALHYFLRLWVMIGLDAEDVIKAYFKKSEVNKFRKATNY